MTREYLLRVIDKHFWVLSKNEIADQIAAVDLSLPDFVVNALQKQLFSLDDAEKIRVLHPYFSDAINTIREHIVSLDNDKLTIWGRENLFDETLLIISIYYHYSGVLLANVMADFLRLVLMKKILLT